ncbi:LOW QUALITY PROTEIN: PIH1 domain-containing protein 1 [Phascolarctos cinereus]|uniref:PIH1 domain-containing protein 1 n=1 Tax=Phascolarctos cinereus TaxID=38626 RepID=A0A6P5LKY4_PHACI|nr:LOW QUALITY PROTEIN: PIH1 domain-containing protein 1 [Phascolarctos cinereus]
MASASGSDPGRDSSLLAAELREEARAEAEEENRGLCEQMLLQAMQKILDAQSSMPDSRQIQPKPGFCVKTRSPEGKVFINVCQSNAIPAPADLSEQELLCVLEGDQAAFRIPMSLGEPHAELDRGGNGCTAYDVAINGDFYKKLRSNDFFLEFFVTVAMEGLEDKYGTQLSREWRLLKYRPFLGSISQQNIRTQSQPRPPTIQELGDGTEDPPLRLWLEAPDLLLAEVVLPKVDSARELSLQLGGDRLVLGSPEPPYHVDIFVPHDISQEQCRAAFNQKSKTLMISMPLQTACS